MQSDSRDVKCNMAGSELEMVQEFEQTHWAGVAYTVYKIKEPGGRLTVVVHAISFQ